jgi:pSer/pThr/pTyr-binding forkhead associated (FHA) protein
MTNGETVHGPPRMWLTTVVDGRPQRVVEIKGVPFVIGRDEECDLVLDDPKVSRRHAQIASKMGVKRTVQDLGSANGTLLNGHALKSAAGFLSSNEPVADLDGGEVLQFGDTIVLASLVDPRTQPDFPGLPAGTSE